MRSPSFCQHVIDHCNEDNLSLTYMFFLQISQHYNIPPRPNITTLSVEVEAQTNCSDISRQKLTLHLKSLCVSYKQILSDYAFFPD